jgi:hypothetical protein
MICLHRTGTQTEPCNECELEKRNASLSRQLIEAQAEIDRLKRTHIEVDGERCRIVPPDVLADITKMQETIERMRPVVEAALTKDFSAVITAVRDYEAKEKP